MNNAIYTSPLSSRYCSDEMKWLFSNDNRYQTWRKLWVSLAKAEAKLGLNISEDQIKELENHIKDINYEVVAQKEAEIRHDVMAHIYAYGEVAPKAKGIIHLGATSCYVTDNADLIIYKDALVLIRKELLGAIKNLKDFALKYKDLPTLGYTHYQPAQLVTVGKRASLWLQDFMLDLEELDFVINSLRFLGSKGTTGTEASFKDLFDNDINKINLMNKMIAKDFNFDKLFMVSGQTYSRKADSRILNVLSAIAQSSYKMAQDIRLLQHDQQIEEPFETKQVGSSAMAYKRNPMRSERICSLARYLISDTLNAPLTAATQFLERSLDDSANRRISMPEGFLCADAILRLVMNVTTNITVNEKIIEKAVYEYLPFIATENIMMEATKNGKDRQEIHEIIRSCSMEEIAKKRNGEAYDLLASLAKHEELGLDKNTLKDILNPYLYTGICKVQVEEICKQADELLEGSELISEVKINI